MQIEIDVRKSVQENANAYFEKSKLARKKLAGLEIAITDMQSKINSLKSKQISTEEPLILKKREKKWFEKFYWFYSTDDFLVLAGRDARSNEVLIKKYLEPTDLFFHSDLPGSAHVIIKNNAKIGSKADAKTESKNDSKKTIPDSTKKQAACFAGIYSDSWRQGHASSDVYSVNPDQVSKQAPSQESLGKGAFMIYGKKNYFRNIALDFAIGLEKKENDFIVIAGPSNAIKSQALVFVELKPTKSKSKSSDLAKKILKFFAFKLKIKPEQISLDELIRVFPPGNSVLATKLE